MLLRCLVVVVGSVACFPSGPDHEALCEGGTGQSCFEAGLALSKAGGAGERIEKLYQRGCELDDRRSCFNLATMLNEGKQVPQDLSRARTLVERSCEKLSCSESCSQLGLMQLRGQGGPQDVSVGEANLKKGCEGGVVQSCVNLGVMYGGDEYGEPKPGHALQYFMKACRGDHAMSCFVASGILHKGQAGPPKPALAKELAQKACDLGHREACSGPMP